MSSDDSVGQPAILTIGGLIFLVGFGLAAVMLFLFSEPNLRRSPTTESARPQAGVPSTPSPPPASAESTGASLTGFRVARLQPQTVPLDSATARTSTPLDRERWLLLLVMVSGLVGSFVHIATSFGDFVGNRQLKRPWLLWYALRLPIGMSLAVLFYLVLRGGLLTVQGTAELNPVGLAAISALVGLSSQKATDKLKEMFDTLFAPKSAPPKRADPLHETEPRLTGVEPASLPSKAASQAVRVTGANLPKDAEVFIDGTRRTTTFVSPSALDVTVEASDLAQAGSLVLTVHAESLGDKVVEGAVLKVT